MRPLDRQWRVVGNHTFEAGRDGMVGSVRVAGCLSVCAAAEMLHAFSLSVGPLLTGSKSSTASPVNEVDGIAVCARSGM